MLGDDLALNAQQVTGVAVNRELPVVWAVFKGSLRNKCILVPAALLISAFAPWAVTPLLMVGGAFLCFEGAEKLIHRFMPHASTPAGNHEARAHALQDERVDMVAFEREKIKGAVRTDFILSAEIIAITLGAVAGADFVRQAIVVTTIALAMTVGVYGLVAGIVRLDDLGLHLRSKSSALARGTGNVIVRAAPYLMKTLSVVGTAAMFMVGGAILTHGIAPVHHAIEHVSHMASSTVWVQATVSTVMNAVFGVVAGAVIVGVVSGVKRLLRR